jgi:hypothetical protein
MNAAAADCEPSHLMGSGGRYITWWEAYVMRSAQLLAGGRLTVAETLSLSMQAAAAQRAQGAAGATAAPAHAWVRWREAYGSAAVDLLEALCALPAGSGAADDGGAQPEQQQPQQQQQQLPPPPPPLQQHQHQHQQQQQQQQQQQRQQQRQQQQHWQQPEPAGAGEQHTRAPHCKAAAVRLLCSLAAHSLQPPEGRLLTCLSALCGIGASSGNSGSSSTQHCHGTGSSSSSDSTISAEEALNILCALPTLRPVSSSSGGSGAGAPHTSWWAAQGSPQEACVEHLAAALLQQPLPPHAAPLLRLLDSFAALQWRPSCAVMVHFDRACAAALLTAEEATELRRLRCLLFPKAVGAARMC